MCLIVPATEGTQIRQILDHIGVESEPARITRARVAPLRGKGVEMALG